MIMGQIMLRFDHEDIQKHLPYAVICEAREGARWETARRKAMWRARFTESEREAARRIFKQAHEWYLVKGAPETTSMSAETFELWVKLGDFCAEI